MLRTAKYALFAAFWLFSVMLSAAYSRPSTTKQDALPDVLYAKSLAIIGENGKPSIMMTNVDGGPKIFLYSKTSRPLISLGISEAEGSTNASSQERAAGIFIHAENGEPLVKLSLIGDTALISATNPGMHANAAMLVDKSSAKFTVDNQDGKSLVAINLGKHQPGITIYDAEKKFKWKTPLD